ncbi:MAG: tetratricopeptide repeat protein [Treponema sp.]|jgi:tetratricopeptide (TPR) repeat protein|nr:tetratricopeptide repeat protein [Treponema sp.]
MKNWFLAFLLLLVMPFDISFAQSQGNWGDGEVARQYVKWAETAIAEDRWGEALAGLERASDFASVSSDISYLLALARFHERGRRSGIIESLDKALEINRWTNYNPQQAYLLKTEQLIGMRNYSGALAMLDRMKESADSAMQRLLALKGLAETGGWIGIDPIQALAKYRSLTVTAFDRYPRDPRPLRIFLEYARKRKPGLSPVTLGSRPLTDDVNLLELALRRLPFLMEADPDLAWMAAPFMRDAEAARRLVASYRAETVFPNPGSIAAALNLGLIDEKLALEELFSSIAVNEGPVLDKDLIMEIGELLRSEEGRELFTQKLLSFTGVITYGEEDGYVESRAFYRAGVILEFILDLNRAGIIDLSVSFGTDGIPLSARRIVSGEKPHAAVQWERYPSVRQITFLGETFLFRPADFQFAPVHFTSLGGSKNNAGLAYPVPERQNMDLTRKTLVSFCESIVRPSVEFDGVVERIFLERGIPSHAVETLDEKRVSVTRFEKGAPVIQYLDFDLDGRIETIRRFNKPGADFENTFNIRDLTASSISDWTGEGIYKTGELYLPDGSVVFLWDMDGDGVMDYKE